MDQEVRIISADTKRFLCMVLVGVMEIIRSKKFTDLLVSVFKVRPG